MWIASVVNIDWPSAPGLTAAQQKAELVALYDTAVARGMNTVVLQVRPTADAFWPSPYEPWSKYLTGTQGQNPGYDPLRFAVAQAHARNLTIHGWFNPYRVSMDVDRSALVSTHPARVHPDWVLAYGGKLYYNPGIPAARRFCVKAIVDAVAHADLDGVHFDDYFYPYPVAGEVFDDDATFAKYGAGFATKAAWRRHNIDLLVREVAAAVHALKPHVQFGVSPFGVWRNKATDPLGSATTAGVQTYDDLAADTRKWVREEWLDYIAPQVYWARGFPAADYDVIVAWWARQLRESGSRVRLYIGQATYKVGASTQSPAWNNDPAELSNHLTYNRGFPEVSGDLWYNASSVVADPLGSMTLVKSAHYAHPALVPTMTWLDGSAPSRVRLVVASTRAGHVRLSWLDALPAARGFAVYRFDGHAAPTECQLADATRLVATVPSRPGRRLHRWDDPTADPAGAYTYAVSAFDVLGNESQVVLARH